MLSGRDCLSTIVFRSDDVQVDVVGTHVVHDRKPWRTGGSPRHGSLSDSRERLLARKDNRGMTEDDGTGPSRFRRRRSRRCCGRLVRCRGARTSLVVPSRRWMIPKPTCSVLAAGLVVAAVAGTSGTNDRLAVWW